MISIKLWITFADIFFILSNSADPDEMQSFVAINLGLHCLPKYLFTRMKRVDYLIWEKFFAVKLTHLVITYRAITINR